MHKVTARAHSNVAFVKYWGKKDEKLRTPSNSSISMNLSDLFTTTTVEFIPTLVEDEIVINQEKRKEECWRVIEHLNRIRAMGNIHHKAKVVSQTNFPIGTGLSSSASGFAALTVAASHAIGMHLSEKELSILARLGSGSACRSIPQGFVEWEEGKSKTGDDSFARTIFDAHHWDILDIVVIVSKNRKNISSSQGQQRAYTSPFYTKRIEKISNKITLCKKYISEKNFTLFGQLVEMDALEMHAIMITSWPPLLYWLPDTLFIMQQVQSWREKDGLVVFYTINTGQDIHIFCQKKDKEQIIQKINSLQMDLTLIPNSPSRGSYLIEDHLF